MTEPRSPRILIVDAEESITHLLSLAVELEGWLATTAADGASAIAAVARTEPDILLIDGQLPDVPGTDVVAFLRERGMTTPVVLLTARSSPEDRLAAFASGADDVVTKPFGLEEVIDRVHPIVRRLGLAPTSRTVADLVLDDEAAVAWRGDEFIPLTPMEYEMLHALAERPGSRMTVGELIRATAVRGIRVPRDFADRILHRVKTLVNGAGRALVHGDDAGWMLAAG